MRFALMGVLMVMFGGIIYMLYIVFNYAFFGPTGMKPILWDSANKTMTGQHLTDWNALMTQLPDGFRITLFLIFGLAVVFFLVDAFNQGPRELQ